MRALLRKPGAFEGMRLEDPRHIRLGDADALRDLALGQVHDAQFQHQQLGLPQRVVVGELLAAPVGAETATRRNCHKRARSGCPAPRSTCSDAMADDHLVRRRRPLHSGSRRLSPRRGISEPRPDDSLSPPEELSAGVVAGLRSSSLNRATIWSTVIRQVHGVQVARQPALDNFPVQGLHVLLRHRLLATAPRLRGPPCLLENALRYGGPRSWTVVHLATYRSVDLDAALLPKALPHG